MTISKDLKSCEEGDNLQYIWKIENGMMGGSSIFLKEYQMNKIRRKLNNMMNDTSAKSPVVEAKDEYKYTDEKYVNFSVNVNLSSNDDKTYMRFSVDENNTHYPDGSWDTRTSIHSSRNISVPLNEEEDVLDAFRNQILPVIEEYLQK